ncbi:NAD(P)-dependent oxidoreductase [Roseomonas sp. NAR14]|uniref:NAD(P)-dependent oxidoreductase n=1 Tax=Roseomonas acroporae TaxID=2937791 RepID=A0A9X1Y675_9PROT|nr:NAD(P)-dependent oxidoreductase [Roseomonas acroporae]MCK8782975.1 NAD(P)-dependent oxidoreductase [Roseomonas acroporae]
MAVLVTGGSGFVGLNVAAALLGEGEAVVLFDRAPPPGAALAAFAPLPGRLAVETGDVRDGAALRAVLRRHGVRRVVHGAAITAAQPREATQAREIAEVNLIGTIEMLEAALAEGVGRVVQFGTGAVFGEPVQVALLDEARDAPVPESLYGITKYAAERVALRYRRTRGLDVAVARLGVVFGRWEYDTGVRDTLSLPLQLALLAEAGRHARVPASVSADWVYATDVAGAVARLLAAPSLPGAVYQVATGRPWSVESWCARLAARHPGFAYTLVGPEAAADVGGGAPRPRPPFAVERLRREVGFAAAYGEAEAFADYAAWREAWARGQAGSAPPGP